MKTQKRSLFIRILLFICALIVVIGCAGGVLLWQHLQRYERSQPDYYARMMVQAFKDKDTHLLAGYTLLPASLQKSEHLLAYLNEVVDPATLHYARLSDPADDEQIYQIQTQTTPIAKLTVSPTGNRQLGLEYNVRSLELLTPYRYRFTVPSGVQLLVNGTVLSQKYLVSQQEIGQAFGELGSVYTVDTYVIEEPFYLDSVSATDADGNAAVVEVDRNAHTVVCSLQPHQQQVQQFVEDFIRPYLVYVTQKNGPSDPLFAMLYPEGAFAAALQQYSNADAHTYDTAECVDLQIGNIVALSATDRQCDVSLTYVITKGEQQISFPFSQTLYLTTRNGQLQLLNMSPTKGN